MRDPHASRTLDDAASVEDTPKAGEVGENDEDAVHLGLKKSDTEALLDLIAQATRRIEMQEKLLRMNRGEYEPPSSLELDTDGRS